MQDSTIPYKNCDLRFTDRGKGKPVVLLHGYLESLEIWNDFSESLANDFRVIAIDLPGHGKSGITGNIATMEFMAGSVNIVLEHLNIPQVFVIGHSMGGYVALAFATEYDDKVAGFSLFHSTPYPDNDEKKANRDREIELVKAGKKDSIINVNIPKAFATQNLGTMHKQVKYAVSIASDTVEDGIIAALEGMKRRRDMSDFVKQYTKPFLLILGEKDNYIPFETINGKIQLPEKAKKIALKNSGHLGFFEEKSVSLSEIKMFVSSIDY